MNSERLIHTAPRDGANIILHDENGAHPAYYSESGGWCTPTGEVLHTEGLVTWSPLSELDVVNQIFVVLSQPEPSKAETQKDEVAELVEAWEAFRNEAYRVADSDRTSFDLDGMRDTMDRAIERVKRER